MPSKDPVESHSRLAPEPRVRVKFCGITRPEDALAGVCAGADAIGLVFYPPSPRAVAPIQAQEIISVLPPFVTVVGLFVDAERSSIEQILDRVHIDLLQFHGDEGPQQCAALQRPYIKAVRMRPGSHLTDLARRYSAARALLLDTYVSGKKGGTGQVFDWARARIDLGIPLILAGGLRPENVADAIRQARPFAVDVSGGIEQSPGLKDLDKMQAFMRNVSSVSL